MAKPRKPVPPAPRSAAALPPPPKGILELDRFTQADVERWNSVSGDLDEREYGMPITNKRISVTPLAIVAEGVAKTPEDFVAIAATLDRAARDMGVNFLGGFSALVHKGATPGDAALMASIPQALATTERVCSSVNIGSTKAGINMDAVAEMGRIIKAAAAATASTHGFGAAKLVVFCNAVEDNPFMAGAFHGVGEPDCVINAGVSGPGVVLRAVEAATDANFGEIASIIKRTAFKITRMGELVGRAASERLGVPFGIVDLSLAPTPAQSDSVARIHRGDGAGARRHARLDCGARLAQRRGEKRRGNGVVSCRRFIGRVHSGERGHRHDRSRRDGRDQFRQARSDDGGAPDSRARQEGWDWVEFGGLLGRAPVMPVNLHASTGFIARGGRIPAPIQALNN